MTHYQTELVIKMEYLTENNLFQNPIATLHLRQQKGFT